MQFAVLLEMAFCRGDFPTVSYRKCRLQEGQIGRNGSTKKLKLRKTLHLADTIGGGKRIQENPPPGTKATCL